MHTTTTTTLPLGSGTKQYSCIRHRHFRLLQKQMPPLFQLKSRRHVAEGPPSATHTLTNVRRCAHALNAHQSHVKTTQASRTTTHHDTEDAIISTNSSQGQPRGVTAHTGGVPAQEYVQSEYITTYHIRRLGVSNNAQEVSKLLALQVLLCQVLQKPQPRQPKWPGSHRCCTPQRRS